jgi:hypothetical protein
MRSLVDAPDLGHLAVGRASMGSLVETARSADMLRSIAASSKLSDMGLRAVSSDQAIYCLILAVIIKPSRIPVWRAKN